MMTLMRRKDSLDDLDDTYLLDLRLCYTVSGLYKLTPFSLFQIPRTCHHCLKRRNRGHIRPWKGKQALVS